MGVQPAVLGGVALVVVGGVLLLRNLGIVDLPVMPLVLIGVGVVVLASARRSPREHTPESAALSLDGASRARLILNHGAGTLRVGPGAAAGHLFDGRFTGGASQQVRRTGDVLEVTLKPAGDVDRWIGRTEAMSWDVALSAAVPVELEVRTGASRVTLDLTELTVPDLSVKTGASDVDVMLPAHGTHHTAISAGAADVRVHVPAGVSANVRNRSALAGFSIDQTRFPKVNGSYRSPDYDSATDRADIDIDGGVASFSVR